MTGLWRWSRRNPLDRLPRAANGMRILGAHTPAGDIIHPDILKLLPDEQRDWRQRLDRVRGSGVPVAGLGFAGLLQPNIEPTATVFGTALTASTETNLYTPATTTNAAWALIPIGSLRAPQTLVVNAFGTIQTSTSSLTCAWTSRIGTSATPSSNASLGATGAMALPSTLTTLWAYQALITIRSYGAGTAGSAVGSAEIMVGNAAAGSITSATAAISGISSAVTFDSSIQQGFVISCTGGASTTVTPSLTQFMLGAWD